METIPGCVGRLMRRISDVGLGRFTVSAAVVLAVWVGFAPFASAINIGGIEYAVLGIGGTSLGAPSNFEIYQSGTVINGNVGQGPFTLVTHGIDATINGTWYFDPSSNCAGRPCGSTFTTPVSVTGIVSGGFVQQNMAAVVNAAIAKSAAYAALAPTLTLTTLNENAILQLAPGQNVIRILQPVTLKETLTLNCPTMDCSLVFQFAATNTIKNILSLSGVQMSINGITADKIVWNLYSTAPSGFNDIAITSGATVYGTFLAPFQDFLVDQGNVTGQVIGGGGDDNLLSIHSSSTITDPTPQQVPEPSSFLTLGLALIAGALGRKKFST